MVKQQSMSSLQSGQQPLLAFYGNSFLQCGPAEIPSYMETQAKRQRAISFRSSNHKPWIIIWLSCLINHIYYHPVVVVGHWVKGHYTGIKHKFKHGLKEEADHLATSYQKHQLPPFHTRTLPLAPLHYRVHLIHRNTVITSMLYSTIASSLHDDKIISHILKRQTGPSAPLLEFIGTPTRMRFSGKLGTDAAR